MELKLKTIVPDNQSNSGKKTQVKDMFNNIAPSYDMLNHMLSLGIDKYWRKQAIKEIKKVKHDSILDIATGTGDLAIAAAKTGAKSITGIDIADEMLDIGKGKINAKNLTHQVILKHGDSEQLEFPSNSFDIVMCAYGVRNFENLKTGLQEMYRTIKANGSVIILEFSQPQKFPIKQFYKFYFNNVLPLLGKFLSKHNSAYTYLPQSVAVFPQGKAFCDILSECGFKEPTSKPLTFGVTTLYIAKK